MSKPNARCNALRVFPAPAATAFLMLVGCSQPAATDDEPIKVDLVTLEDCQRADLLGKRKFTFHLYECFAEVQLSEMGEVVSFKPWEGKEDICRKVIEECRWQ